MFNVYKNFNTKNLSEKNVCGQKKLTKYSSKEFLIRSKASLIKGLSIHKVCVCIIESKIIIHINLMSDSLIKN